MTIDRFHQSLKKQLSFFYDLTIGFPPTLGAKRDADSTGTSIEAADYLPGTYVAIMLRKILFHCPRTTTDFFFSVNNVSSNHGPGGSQLGKS